MSQILAIAIYAVATLIFILIGLIIVYHLVKYGFIGDATRFMVVIFVIISILLIISSSVFVARTNWKSLSSNSGNSKIIQSDKPILGY